MRQAADQVKATRDGTLKIGDRVRIVDHPMKEKIGHVGRVVAITRKGSLETLTVRVVVLGRSERVAGLLPSQVRKLPALKKAAPKKAAAKKAAPKKAAAKKAAPKRSAPKAGLAKKRSPESARLPVHFGRGSLAGDVTTPPPAKRRVTRGGGSSKSGSELVQRGVSRPSPKGQSKGTRPVTRSGRTSPPPGPRKPSQPKITCYFHAEMDREVVVEHTATIEVQVSREAIERVGEHAVAQRKAKVSSDRKLLVQVIPKKNFELEDEGRQKIDPPGPSAPQTLRFDVRATHLGDGEVWVVAVQDQEPLVTLPLKVKIVAERKGRTSRVTAHDHSDEAPRLKKPLHQLLITEQYSGNQLRYRFELLINGELEAYGFSREISENRDEYVERIYEQIETRWISSQTDLRNFFHELRAYGSQLFNELIPLEVQQALWAHRDSIDSIQVYSEEPFIPWELVHVKEPGTTGLGLETHFLGQMGMVRWHYGVKRPPQALRIRKGKARYVIPSYPVPRYVLREAEQEARFLKQRFAATAVAPEPDKVRDLLSRPGSFDLLHFACHGQADAKNIAQARLLMQGRMVRREYVEESLSATVVKEYANLGRDQGYAPVVVLNACQVGREGYQLTGTGGFAQAFLAAGAGAFIGTLWSVGDSPARTFTETFYKALLDNSTIAAATIKARRAAESSGKDATWLAYVVYGHPHAKLKST
jgi:hypothetical protein